MYRVVVMYGCCCCPSPARGSMRRAPRVIEGYVPDAARTRPDQSCCTWASTVATDVAAVEIMPAAGITVEKHHEEATSGRRQAMVGRHRSTSRRTRCRATGP